MKSLAFIRNLELYVSIDQPSTTGPIGNSHSRAKVHMGPGGQAHMGLAHWDLGPDLFGKLVFRKGTLTNRDPIKLCMCFIL